MSNKININFIKDKDGYAGFTVYDDFDSETKFIDGTPEDDIELLKFVKEYGGPSTQDALLFCDEFQKGMYINENWYSYEEIKNYLST